MSSKDYFDQVAHQWDNIRGTFFSSHVRNKALSTAGVQGGEIAADIGAGSGFVTEGLIGKGLGVIAVDPSEAMLAEMRRKFAGIAGLDYCIGDASQLPISDEVVDYAFANMCLHHVEVPLTAIKEMVRILRPGGKLVITDLDQHYSRFLRNEHHDRWLGFNRAEIRQWFTEAGLKGIVVDCVGENCCAQSGCGRESASINIFVASGEKWA